MVQFTEDWFTNNVELWKKHLSKLRKKKLTVLEIGCFEGRSAIWLLENILLHPKSKIYCIDHWMHSGEHNKQVYQTFLKNIEPYKNKVEIIKGYSGDSLRKITQSLFDFVYIDGNKHSQNVIEDAVLSFPLIKPNGIMILDDYTHNKEHDINCPRPGIDAFMNLYANEIQVLHTRWQVVLKKRKNPLKRRACYSEFYREPERIPIIYKNINLRSSGK